MLSDREHHLGTVPAKAAVDGLAERYAINGHRVVLYTGTFEAYQGLDLLVDAALEIIPRYKNIRFLCVGGSESKVAVMKLLVDRRGVAAYFIFPGSVPPEDVQFFYEIATILISPRTSGTNTPLKIYSYLRSGVPIVATRIISHTQVLTDDVAVLVEPRPESLSMGILRLLENSQLGTQLAQNAKQLAEKCYSPEAYHQKMAEVLSFLSGKPRSNT
jgi:glycosyltransferase involved in cell wall biosynthesis